MKTLTIECKGIGNISFYNGIGDVELQEIDMSFLEDVSAEDIVKNKNAREILDAMDYEEIADYLESKYDIEPIRERR